MILYRGTPEPEDTPRPRRYACAFFAPDFDYAAEYGRYVQKYRVGRQRILQFGGPSSRRLVLEFTGHRPARDHNDEVELDLFWHPTKEWRDFVSAAGYTGTAMGWNICIFDLSGLKLIGRWSTEEPEGRVQVRRQA